MQSLGVFGLCQIMAFIAYLQSSMSKEHFEALFRFLFLIVLAILGVGLGVLTLSGKVAPWTGRSVVNMEGEFQQVAQSRNLVPI